MAENTGEGLSGQTPQAPEGPPKAELTGLLRSAQSLRRTRAVATIFRLIALAVIVVVVVVYVSTIVQLYRGVEASQDDYFQEVTEGLKADVLPKVRSDVQDRLNKPELREWIRKTTTDKVRAALPEYRALIQKEGQLLKTHVLENTTTQLKQKLAGRLAQSETKFKNAFPELQGEDVDVLVGNLQLMLQGGTSAVVDSRMQTCYDAVEQLGETVASFPPPKQTPDHNQAIQRVIQIVFELQPYQSQGDLTRVQREFRDIHWPTIIEKSSR